MWLIGILNHAETTGLGVTWQVDVAVVLFMGITGLTARRKRP